jgi:transcriptional regulator with XRE-family HTH domain
MADAVKGAGGRRRGGEGPHPIDIHVGARLRMRRTLLGMSQEKLADAVGVTFQQIQKYERGANRIGSSRLHQFSKVLDVPVAYFFHGLDGEDGGSADTAGRGGLAETPAERFDDDIMTRRETIELIRAYYRIGDVRIRRRLMDLTKALGKSDDEGDK